MQIKNYEITIDLDLGRNKLSLSKYNPPNNTINLYLGKNISLLVKKIQKSKRREKLLTRDRDLYLW